MNKTFFVLATVSLATIAFLFFHLHRLEQIEIPPPTNPYKEKLNTAIDTYFRQAVAERQIVGAAVAIVYDDSIQYLGCFGRKAINRSDTIDPNTIFRIGSLSKGFAGVLGGMLVEEKQLSWKDKMVDYVPDFRLKYRYQTKAVTFDNLLSHTSGFPYHAYTNLIEEELPLRTIARYFRDISLIGPPGKLFSYQNAAFALSGEMMAVATKQPFGELLQSRIFNPLGMNNASATYEAITKASNVAMPHYRRRGKWKKMRITRRYYNAVPAGGINASITDMAKWMRFLLKPDSSLIKNETLEEVFRPAVTTQDRRRYYQRWDGHQESYYGMGWRIHTFLDSRGETDTLIHHGGYVNGFRSEIALDPQKGLGICVLFNSQNYLSGSCIPYCREQYGTWADSIRYWEGMQ